MTLKGDLPILAEIKKDPSMIDPNRPADEVQEKPKPDPIDKSLKARLAAGSYTS